MFSINRRQKISLIISGIFFTTSFLSITVFSIFGLSIIFLLFLSIFLLKNKIQLQIEDIHVIFLFYMLFFTSFAIISFLMIFIQGISYVQFYPSMFGRMANITIYLTIFVFIINVKNKKYISTNFLLNAYLMGCYVLLFFGIWEITNIFFKVPYPDFGTRNAIHSMDRANLLSFMKIRTTSIAREPAFLMPYLIDAIIILFYVYKKYLSIILFVIILFFSLSLSGYINLFLIFTIIMLFSKITKTNIIIKIFIFLCGIYSIFLLRTVFISVFQRLNLNQLILSMRVQNIILALKYMFFDTSLFNTLFGLGPKGMEYMRRFVFFTSGWLQGESIGATTLVIFFDFFIEYGIIGLLMVVLLFYYLYKLAKKTYKSTGNRLSQVLCLNLVISSLYTADFASPRFTGIIILILCLYKDAVADKYKLKKL